MSNEKFTIETGVPMPTTRRGKAMKYPFDQLFNGDSFLVTDEAEAKSVVSCARSYGIRNKVELLARRTDDGIRVWRLDGPTRAEHEAQEAGLTEAKTPAKKKTTAKA